jgi:hypothetical protein
MPSAPPSHFLVLVYRMSSHRTADRVYVWRMLKKMGAVYLQQSVTALPDSRTARRELQPILERITAASGAYHLLPLRALSAAETEKLRAQFIDQASRHYDEIIENCKVDFAKEVEFETYRENFTYEEAEEIRAEYEKIVSWFERVAARDWFEAPNRQDAWEWIDRSRASLEEFERRVFLVQHGGAPACRGARQRLTTVASPLCASTSTTAPSR